MKFKKIVLSAIFAAAVTACTGIANAQSNSFETTQDYSDGMFSDVKNSDWYNSSVESAYEFGFMSGVGNNLFDPNGNVTLAQAITVAARANAIYNGKEIENADGAWYNMYVNYAKSNGIISEGEYKDYNVPAFRKDVARIFKRALPADYYTLKNNVTEIPDVSQKHPYYNDILALYKAGIVMGSDDFGNFLPEDNIKRSEIAAIITRVANPEMRLAKTLDKISKDDAYSLVITPGLSTGREYSPIQSGWALDNRGGVPRTSANDNYGALNDISTDAGTAYIRHFNKITTGKLDLDTKVSTKAKNGVYMEFQNDKGESVYRVQIKDGKWQILSSGAYTPIYEIKEDESEFIFNCVIDIDNARSTTYINSVSCGSYPLSQSTANANILNFRFATTKEDTANLLPYYAYINVNYALSSKSQVLNNSSKSYYFDRVSGKVISEFDVLLPKGEAIEYSLMSSGKKVLTFTTDDKSFYVNSQKVYENYYQNLWYKLYLELDTDTNKINVKVNGKSVATTDFAYAATSFDCVVVSTTANTDVSFDDIKVYKTIEHSDYVPKPVIPNGQENYTVGINACSIWRNGNSWAAISPYEENKPILGFYDEGVAETADWEIKYLLEHGVDFQSFCIYFPSSKGVQKLTNPEHIFDGYMNAKYSDMMKFSVIFEAGSSQSPANLEEWKNNYVPVLIEYFFKDSRYMTIENKPLLMVYGSEYLASRMEGGEANVKAAFDYLEEQVKLLGFDGMIYLSCGTANAQMKAMGFDGAYAYNWSDSGSNLGNNKNNNIASAETNTVYAVPTISVGFNNVAWAGTRHNMMSVSDYKKAHEWVKNEYLPKYAKEAWQKNFTMVSTWNEYGEGTYIMPCKDLNGFGYLDVLREAYTGEKANASLNTVPTQTQLQRINHLYPQYHSLLKRDYSEVQTKGIDVNVFINDEKVKLSLKPEKAQNGEILIPFEPASATDYRLNTYHTWNKVENTLTLNFKNDTLVFSVGKDTYTLNGTSKPLGFTLYAIDDIPMLPISKICADVKYQITQSDREIKITTDQKAYFDKLHETKPGQWEFNNEGNLEDWTSSNMTLSVSDGKLIAVSNDTGNDPSILSLDRLNLPCAKYKTMEVGISFEAAQAANTLFKIYFTTDLESKSTEDKGFQKWFAGYSTNGISQTLTFDLTQNPKWIGKLRQLRVDPFNNPGTAHIDFIRLIEDPNYVPSPEDEADSGKDDGFKIVNGDAQSSGGFYSDASLSIIDDPEQNGNKIYKAMPLNDQKTYLYVKHDVTFTPGATYNVEFDAKIASLGTKDPTSDTVTNVTLNAIYSDTAGNNHIAGRLRLTPKDGWKHASYTFTVSASSASRNADVIALYTDPYGDMGVGYCFDNVKVTEILPGDNASLSGGKELNIVNGNAEGNGGFSQDSAAVIVTDPDNGSNKVFKRVPADNNKTWLYTYQNVNYTAGKTYTLEYDVKLASLGTNENPSSDVETYIYFNAQYNDPNGRNHTFGKTKVTASDGWKHIVTEFTISDDYIPSANDLFAFYSDPYKDMGVGYYLDNVKILADGEVPAYTVPSLKVTNGDAEGIGGLSQDSLATISADPENSSNKVFKRVPTDNSKTYLYAYQNIEYTAGTTYILEYDVKLASLGTNENIPADLETYIYFNAQYNDPDGRNHTFGKTKVTAADGWKHITVEFRINDSYVADGGDLFAFYSDPQREMGIGYYIDNIKVTTKTEDTGWSPYV